MRLVIALIMVGIVLSATWSYPVLLAPAGAHLTALESNDRRALADLVRRGMDVNKPDRLGVTPLMAAAQLGRADMAGLLLRHGASVNAESPFGSTPLACAALTGNADTVGVLLRSGANP